MSATGPQRLPADLEGKKFIVEWGLDRFQAVKEFSAEFLESEKDRDLLKGLMLLRYASEQKNRAAADKAIAEAAELLLEETSLRGLFKSGNPREVAGLFYPAFFSREMKAATVVMWRTKTDQFLPAIFCESAKAAAFVAAAFRGLAVCPNCLKLFDPFTEHVDGSRSETYCTAACGSRYRQKLYRTNMKIRERRAKRKVTKRRKGKR